MSEIKVKLLNLEEINSEVQKKVNLRTLNKLISNVTVVTSLVHLIYP